MHQLGYKDKVFIHMTVDCVFMFMIFSLKAKIWAIKKQQLSINVHYKSQSYHPSLHVGKSSLLKRD